MFLLCVECQLWNVLEIVCWFEFQDVVESVDYVGFFFYLYYEMVVCYFEGGFGLIFMFIFWGGLFVVWCFVEDVWVFMYMIYIGDV